MDFILPIEPTVLSTLQSRIFGLVNYDGSRIDDKDADTKRDSMFLQNNCSTRSNETNKLTHRFIGLLYSPEGFYPAFIRIAGKKYGRGRAPNRWSRE
jgi:hypothetical protein